MSRVRALAVLVAATHLLSCGYTPCEPPAAWPSPLPNGWPSFCAPVVGRQFYEYGKCYGEESLPSTRNVGVHVQFRFAGRITEPVPLVYLGVRELPEFDGRPLFGQTLGAHTMVWDPDTDKTTASFAVWALPSAGTHVFVLPKGEVAITLPTDAVPSAGCVAPVNLDVADPGTFSQPSTINARTGKPLILRELAQDWLYYGLLKVGWHLDDDHRVEDSFVFVSGMDVEGIFRHWFIGMSWPGLGESKYRAWVGLGEANELMVNAANVYSTAGFGESTSGEIVPAHYEYARKRIEIPSLGISLSYSLPLMFDRLK